MRTELLMIRHGQSQGNAGLTKEPDCCLSDLGQEQARTAAAMILRHEVDGFVAITSPYLRARQTAEAISEKTGMVFEIEPLVREWQWSGPAKVEGVDYPMEAVENLVDRLTMFLRKYEGRKVLVVSHAGPISVITQLAWGETPNPHVQVENARPRWVKVTASFAGR
jgi:broad specificity phosphatase PhoE